MRISNPSSTLGDKGTGGEWHEYEPTAWRVLHVGMKQVTGNRLDRGAACKGEPPLGNIRWKTLRFTT